MRILTNSLFLFLIVPPVFRCVRAEELVLDLDQAGVEYIERYQSQYRQVREWYSELTGRVAVSGKRGLDSRPDETLTYTYEFYSRGNDLKRLDKELPKLENATEENPRREVTMVNEFGFFVATNEGRDGAMVLRETAADQETGIRRIEMEGVLGCQFCMFGVPLDNWLFEAPKGYSNYKINAFERTRLLDRPVVRLGATFEAGPEQGHWWVTLDEETGVLMEYDIGSRSSTGIDQSRRASIEYEFSESGAPPAVAKLISWVTDSQGDVVYNKHVHDVLEFDRSAPDRSVFYPESIGLDLEYGKGTSWVWYLGIALILLLLSVGAAKVGASRRGQRPETPRL